MAQVNRISKRFTWNSIHCSFPRQFYNIKSVAAKHVHLITAIVCAGFAFNVNWKYWNTLHNMDQHYKCAHNNWIMTTFQWSTIIYFFQWNKNYYHIQAKISQIICNSNEMFLFRFCSFFFSFKSSKSKATLHFLFEWHGNIFKLFQFGSDVLFKTGNCC